MTTIKTSAFVAEIDHSELTVRLLEVGCGLKRPEGKSAYQILTDAWDAAEGKPINQKTLADFEYMAQAAIEYLAEQINKGGKPQ